MKILESTTFQDTLVSRYISLNDILITIHVTDQFFRTVVHNDLKVVWKKVKVVFGFGNIYTYLRFQ